MHIVEVAHVGAPSSVHVCVGSLDRSGLRVVGEGKMGGIYVGLRQDTVNARIEVQGVHAWCNLW